MLALLAGATLAGDLAAAPGTKDKIREKQAQAQSVLGQVNALDQRLGASVEAWNGARYELGLTQKQLKHDQANLRRANAQRRLAIKQVEARLVAIYEGSSDSGTLGILLGSETLSGVLDRLNAAHEIAKADHDLAVRAKQARDRYAAAAKRTAALESQRVAQVRQRDAQRRQIESMLATERHLEAGIQSELTVLNAKEAREQAALRAQAEARLAAERAAAAEQAARAAAAAKAAAAAAAKKAEAARPTTTTTAPADPSPGTTTTAPTTTVVVPNVTTTAPVPANLPPGHPQAAQIVMSYL